MIALRCSTLLEERLGAIPGDEEEDDAWFRSGRAGGDVSWTKGKEF